jgi:alkylhydroperoxidase family enzyme
VWVARCPEPVVVAAPAAPAPEATKPPPSPVAERRAKVEAAKEREPFVPLLSVEATKENVPTMRRFAEPPTLVRAAAARPKTTEAEMRAFMALQRESTLGRDLLQEVFLVVSSANECGY